MRELLFAALLATAYAIKLPVGRFIANKIASQNGGLCLVPTILNPAVCSLNVGDLWYICGQYGYNEAVHACAAYGWRVAMVTDANRADVAEIVQSCQGPTDFSAWIAGDNGLPGDPCAFVFNLNNFMASIFSVGTEICSSIFSGIVCQDMPQITTTTTDVITVSVQTSGTSTQTTTSIVTVPIIGDPGIPDRPPHESSSSSSCCCDPSSSSSSSCSSSSSSSCCRRSSSSSSSSSCRRHWKNIEIEKDAFDPPCFGENCAPVCSARAEGIRILLTRVNATQAALECLKYGWSLLDLTYGREGVLARLLDECSPEFPIGYVASFNGVANNCTTAQLIGLDPFGEHLGIAVGFPVNDNWCTVEADFLPICQVECPVITGTGAEPGQQSITTTTTDVITTAVTPSTTTTTTTTCTEFVRRGPV